MTVTVALCTLPGVQSWSSVNICGLQGLEYSGQTQDDSESDVSHLHEIMTSR